MAATKLQIYNSALIKIGCDTVASAAAVTKSALLLTAIYDQVRDSVMAAHPWNFTIKRDTITPAVTTPDWGYDYEYTYPTDALRILNMDYDDITFVIEGTKIRSDESELNLLYIYKNTTEAEWSVIFAEAFAWALAKNIVYAMTQSASAVEMCEKAYKAELANARAMDGAEGTLHGLNASTWTLARR